MTYLCVLIANLQKALHVYTSFNQLTAMHPKQKPSLSLQTLMAYKGLKVSSAVPTSRKPSWTQQSSSARLDTWPFPAARTQGLISTACVTLCLPVLCPLTLCPIPLPILHVRGNAWHAPFAFGNISRANGHTFTRSNQAWLVNTRIEVREMLLAIKCLHITHKHTALHDSTPLPQLFM